MNKAFPNFLMVVHLFLLLFTIGFKTNTVVSLISGIFLLAISLFTIVYMCYLVIKERFYFQIIPIIVCFLVIDNMGLYYRSFTNNGAYVYVLLIVLSMLLAIFVGLKCKLKKQKDYVFSTVAMFILVLIFSVCTVDVLNVALSVNEPYVVEYRLVEQTGEYDAHHITSVSTTTYRVLPVDSENAEIEELEIKQSLDIESEDIVRVEIRNGLFENVYRVLGKLS